MALVLLRVEALRALVASLTVGRLFAAIPLDTGISALVRAAPLDVPLLATVANLGEQAVVLGRAHLEMIRRATRSPHGTWLVGIWTRVDLPWCQL